MKITRCSGNTNPITLAELNGTIGCNICPYCGTKKTVYVTKKGYTKGVSKQGYYIIRKGRLFKRTYRVYGYHCYTCDTSWESEPCPIH